MQQHSADDHGGGDGGGEVDKVFVRVWLEQVLIDLGNRLEESIEINRRQQGGKYVGHRGGEKDDGDGGGDGAPGGKMDNEGRDGGEGRQYFTWSEHSMHTLTRQIKRPHPICANVNIA